MESGIQVFLCPSFLCFPSLVSGELFDPCEPLSSSLGSGTASQSGWEMCTSNVSQVTLYVGGTFSVCVGVGVGVHTHMHASREVVVTA